MKVQKPIKIAALPEAVWSCSVEPEKILKWCITFKIFKYIGKHHSGVGTALYVEEKAGRPLMKLNWEVS